MGNIIPLRGKTPTIGKDCYIAPTATLIGDVSLGDGCSVWFGAVLRGDVAPIRLGERVNVQDNAVVHGTYGRPGVEIGPDVSIGHGAIVHGATIRGRSLIGMGAVVLDGAVVEEDVIIAAGAVLTGGKVAERRGIYAGTPARRVRELTDEQCAETIGRTAAHYPQYAQWYREAEADGKASEV